MVRFCALFPGPGESIRKTSNVDPPAAFITNTPVWLELRFRCPLPPASSKSIEWMKQDCWPTPELFSLPSPSSALHQRTLQGQSRYSEDDECQEEGLWLRWIIVTDQTKTHVHNRTSKSLPWAWLCPRWHKDLRADWAREERYLARDC